MIIAVLLALCLLTPMTSLADTDNFARARIRDLQEQVAALESQVQELKATIETLRSRDAEIEQYTRKNFSLIRELARQVPLGNTPGPAVK
jgi:outer membrane murein-binding lipoprotein Lpp